MKKIITAMNNPDLNEELRNEDNVEILCKDIFYKEGILEILENNSNIDYIILDENLPGEIELEKLIENILEKNEKIKIIITIKNNKKIKFKFNNENIIKIFYENKINLNKLKNYNNNLENKEIKKEKINKKILKNKFNYLKIKNKIKNIIYIKLYNKKKENKLEKNKKKETKIITFFGDRNVGKSINIIKLLDYIIRKENKNTKILIIELNKDSPNLYLFFGCKKFNKKRFKERKKIKNSYKKTRGVFIIKYLDIKIFESLIIKLNKNIDLISYNKLLNFNTIKKFEKKYNYLLIENYLKKNKKLNQKIINNSYKNILIIEPNLLGIKNSKKIIEKNKFNKINNFKIIINKFNKYSIDEKILKIIFGKNKIIEKIKYNNEYEKMINSNFKNKNLSQRKFEKNIKIVSEKILE